jgi:predicted RNase H-like nuclease (RuvC/YqgF family)
LIEFALLFALGFLTAAILGLMAAPVVHKRIVRFAEDRLKATMPLSPQEVRAQKDAARAGYAAENARTSQTLKRERDKNVALMLKNESMLQQARQIAGENADLHAQIAEMNVEAADLRSSTRQLEQNIERLKATLAEVERDNVKKGIDIKTLTRQVEHLNTDLDSLKIDSATYDTEAENLKTRIAGLRDEREILRNELRAESTKARELEVRLARDETRIRQFEAKLAREIAENADKDNFLERRQLEIERLKAKIKDANADLRDASKAMRAAGLPLPVRKEKPAAVEAVATSNPPSTAATADADGTLTSSTAVDLIVPAEYARNRAAALAERLTNSKSSAHDDALREEIADIAATMVALTAAKEGENSPIPALLNQADGQAGNGSKSLASRARDMLPPAHRQEPVR